MKRTIAWLFMSSLLVSCGNESQQFNQRDFNSAENEPTQTITPEIAEEAAPEELLSADNMQEYVTAVDREEDMTALIEKAGVDTAPEQEEVPTDMKMEDLEGFVFNRFMKMTDGDEDRASEGTTMFMQLIQDSRSLNPFKMAKTSKKFKNLMKEMKQEQAAKGKVVDILVDVAGICAIVVGACTANPAMIALGAVLVILV